jgi:RHS repeat-associated protein
MRRGSLWGSGAAIGAILLGLLLGLPLAADVHPNTEGGVAVDKAFQVGEIDNVNLFNGSLTLTIPLGQRYPVGGSLSYGLTLIYNSNPWYFLDDATFYPNVYQEGEPNPCSNAGLGWRVSLGQVNPPCVPISEDPMHTGRPIYEAPDGSEHIFYPTLHEGDTPASTVSYTRDGTYLRLQSLAGEYEIDFPDGTIHHFGSDGRLSQMKDGFNNQVNVTYGTVGGHLVWTLTDTQGRSQQVFFREDLPGYPETVDHVVLTAPGGSLATYQFQYTSQETLRGCPNRDLGLMSDVTAPFLTAVVLPDGSSYQMAPNDYVIQTAPTTYGQCFDSSGSLLGLTLPTLGRIEWTYQIYQFPMGTSSRESRQKNHGVATRTTRDALGNVLGRFTYATALTPDSSSPDAQELVNTVTDPFGKKVERHFSVSHVAAHTATDWTVYEYGAQISHYPTAGQPAGLYLSARTYDGAGTLLRSEYAAYEHDQASTAGTMPDESNVNLRMLGQRTVYEDDGGTYGDLTNSNFDGLGHYRMQQTNGNFPGTNVHTHLTQYNPAQGTYAIDPVANTTLPGFTMLPSDKPWVLPTYSLQWDDENGFKVVSEYCFFSNSTQVSRRRVQRVAGFAEDAADLFTSYLLDGNGNVADEKSYGGDVQAGLAFGNVCSLTPAAAPEYEIMSVWHSGALSTSQYSGVPFRSVDHYIDGASGLVLQSKDVAGVATTYAYDALGRLTSSQTGQSAPTIYTYSPASSASSLAHLHVEQQPAGVPASLRPQRDLSFDALGRLVREDLRMANGTTSSRAYAYDALGRTTAVSEQGNPSLLTQMTYDVFDRSTSITAPDGHTTSISYLGTRQVSRTVSIGEQYDTTRGTVREFPQTTIETYDRQGRLVQVTEPIGAGVTTSYTYDVGNRLTQVSTTATVSGSAVTQNRFFNYDRRGLLLSETHPEKGATGNGAVSYPSYDSRGHAARKVDGPNDLTFTFDAAERLTQVRRTGTATTCAVAGGNCLKTFSYGTANSGSDLRLGKLVQAQRWNFPVIGGATHVERIGTAYTYAGLDGRLSQRDINLTPDGDLTPGAHETFTQSWTYDDLGHISTENYPTCAFSACTGSPTRSVSYAYTAGYLTAVPGYTGTVPGQASGVGITYSPNGLVSQVAHSNGVVWTQLADTHGLARPGGFLSQLGGTTYWSTGPYAYDGAGNITQVGSSYYLYDNVSRIGTASFSTQATGGGAATVQSYAYDAFGNLTALTGANGRNLPTAPQTNRLNSLGTSYDAAGNLTAWNGATYEYDAFNQLRHYLNGTQEWLYMYDADDERVWSFQVGASPRFDRWTLRGQDAQVRRDYEVSGFGWANWTVGNTWEDFVYRGGSLLAGYYSNGQQRHYDPDHLGSPRLITNFGSAQVAYHVYFPYGEEATAFNQDVERLKFTGHERDLASTAGAGDDLDYMHARHESSIAGRFLSVDTEQGAALDPQTWNRYTYARGNPVKYLDPDGKAYLLSTDPQVRQDQIDMFRGMANWGSGLPGPGILVSAEEAIAAGGGGLLSRIAQKLANQFANHLDDVHAVAAARESVGEVVALKPNGVPFDHLREFTEARAGAVKLIDRLKAVVADGTLSIEQRASAQKLLTEASKTLDKLERLFQSVLVLVNSTKGAVVPPPK